MRLFALILLMLSAVPAFAQRELLTSLRTYYVRSDGNDANDCLSDSASGACATITKALEKTYALDLGSYGVEIRVGSGTYTQPIVAWAPFVGGNPLNTPTGHGGAVTIRGDVSNPSNVHVSVSNASCVKASYGATLNVSGFKCSVSGSGSGLYASANGQIWITENMEFGDIASEHILANFQGFVSCTHNYIVSGSGTAHWRAVHGGAIECYGLTVFIYNVPQFSTAFAHAHDNGIVISPNTTYTGWTAGKAYDVSYGGIFYGNSPGNMAGTTSNGGMKK